MVLHCYPYTLTNTSQYRAMGSLIDAMVHFDLSSSDDDADTADTADTASSRTLCHDDVEGPLTPPTPPRLRQTYGTLEEIEKKLRLLGNSVCDN